MLLELRNNCTSLLSLGWDPCTSYEFSFHSRYWKSGGRFEENLKWTIYYIQTGSWMRFYYCVCVCVCVCTYVPCFWKKSLMLLTKAVFIWWKKETLWNITVLNIFFIYILQCNRFLWCKAELSASLLQSSVSPDPSEIILICWFAAQETFLIIINVEF